MTTNEIPTDLMRQWSELNKGAMSSIKELGEINTKTLTRLAQCQMEMVNVYMENGAKQLQAFSEVKGVQDVVSVQSKVFAEMNKKLIENAQQTATILADAKSELTSWVEKGMKSVTDVVPGIKK